MTVRERDYAASTATTSSALVRRTSHEQRASQSGPEGAPILDSPADDDADDDYNGPSIDEEDGPKDFYHPASVEPQPIIWMPKDRLGLAEAEEEATRQRGIAISIEHAVMDEKAHVNIDGAPPDGKAKL